MRGARGTPLGASPGRSARSDTPRRGVSRWRARATGGGATSRRTGAPAAAGRPRETRRACTTMASVSPGTCRRRTSQMRSGTRSGAGSGKRTVRRRRERDAFPSSLRARSLPVAPSARVSSGETSHPRTAETASQPVASVHPTGPSLSRRPHPVAKSPRRRVSGKGADARRVSRAGRRRARPRRQRTRREEIVRDPEKRRNPRGARGTAAARLAGWFGGVSRSRAASGTSTRTTSELARRRAAREDARRKAERRLYKPASFLLLGKRAFADVARDSSSSSTRVCSSLRWRATPTRTR